MSRVCPATRMACTRVRLEMPAYRFGDHVMLADNFEPQPEGVGYAVKVEGLHDAHHALGAAIPTRARDSE